MRKLVLIRHAEAKPEMENSTDFDRPLSSSGKKDAAQMAGVLLQRGILPQIIISSPALRALTTANIFTAALSSEGLKTNADIYEAHEDTLLEIVNHLDDQYKVAGLVGHNPGISNLLYLLTGKVITMPTCAWAIVELEAESWTQVSSDTGKLIQFQHP